jgi:DNA-directed RNA polymerase specialized sigma24 family protein
MPISSRSSGDPSDGSDFEEFYLASRRRLVLETYALTGDLLASRSAVRDAFVAARQHWRKVGRLTDPEEWVRPRAWAMAQRRHVARLWRRDKGLTADQLSVLDALHHLPDQQRKVLLLTALAGLSPDDIGRELGETPARVEDQLATATRIFCRKAGAEQTTGDAGRRADAVRAALESLTPIAEATALPTAVVIHRSGTHRRRLHTLTAVVVLVALTIAGGVFVSGGVRDSAAAKPPAAIKDPVTATMLLSLPQVRALAPLESWQLVGTSDNTAGNGINSVCQDARFADPRGSGTFVRSFVATGRPSRTYLQTVEISRSAYAARAAYRTTLGWFAGCSEARLQLLNTYRLRGLGEEAQMLKLRIPGEVSRTYVVGVVRSGSLTVSTVLETLNGRPVPIARALSVLTEGLRNLCAAGDSGPCPSTVAAAPVLPPPSGETPGTLAAADLPVVGRINRPWVGTRPVPARSNVAATTCDKTNFLKGGAPAAMTRTFLIPQAKVPRRFGITETYGAFANPARAAALVRGVTADMAACEKRDLGAEVSTTIVLARGYRGSEYALWRLDSEIDKTSTVSFWMGVARVGRYVAQVNFTPAGDNDIDEVTFQALMTRARDRLFELPATGP